MREQGALKHAHGQLAVGILIVEDIVAIMLLVVLSGVALNGSFEWEEVGEATFLVAVFVMMVFSLGKLLTPGLLRTLQKMDSLEVILLVTMGLVLGVGFLAEQFKFSIALGAFLAGAILAHSSLAEQIEKLTEPFRYLFSAIFFVTVGMIIEPEVLLHQWGTILIVACLVIVGKVFTCWLGLSMSGQGFRNSFKASMAKAQIGEFSFVIAALGQSLGVTDSRLDSITVGTALVTILLTPLLSKHSDGLFDFFAGRMPDAGRQFGQFYLGLLQTIKEHLGKSDLLKLIRRPALQILGYFLVFNGILFLSGLLAHKVTILFSDSNYVRALSAGVWVAGGLCCLPFLVAVIRNLDAILMIVTEATFSRAGAQQVLGGRMSQIFHNILFGFVLVIFGGIYLSAAADYFPSGVSLGGFVLLLIGVGFGFWKKIVNINSRLETLFLESLERQVRHQDHEHRQHAMERITEKYPWPVNLCEITLLDTAMACGRRLKDLRLREQTGASVIAIGRGGFMYYNPEPELPLFPGDCLLLTGEPEQNQAAVRLLTAESPHEASHLYGGSAFHLEKVLLCADSSLIGETLAGANLRRRYGISVIGIQRGEQRITSPQAEEMFQSNDLLLIVGDPHDLELFQKDLNDTGIVGEESQKIQ